jgi:hypothetical protein
MTVINPNINFPEKKNPQKIHGQSRGGTVTTSTISWTYDFRPLIKWGIIILSFGLIALIAWNFDNKKKIEAIKINMAEEAEEVNTRYLEKNLERVKQETIAAENLKRIARESKTERLEPVRQNPSRSPKIYTWINDKGQTVHSNQPKK